MTYRNLYRIVVAYAFSLYALSAFAIAQGGCVATTLEQFYECYGGKSAFSPQAQKALNTFIQAEDAINAGNYSHAKALIDTLYKQYPVGSDVWWQVWTAPNGANVGSPHAYYGLRMMEDIVNYGLHPNPDAKVKKIVMNVVLVGCSKGIQPTTKDELQKGTGKNVRHTIDSSLRQNDYRIIRQSMQLFTKYVQAISNGALEVHIGFIELDTFCLPVKVSTTKPYNASGDYGLVLNALSKAAKDTTDWFLISYPSHVPDLPVFDDESFIAGGMGADSKGGPVFIADDKWLVRKPAHLGKGNYTDIERRIYLPQWFQHEFFHHLYRIYPELKLEVKGHDWFERSFWAADFVGQFETDYYSESLHKRIQRACVPLANKLITRIDKSLKTEYTQLMMEELLGSYSLDVIQNDWHEGSILAESGKYYWKNKANVRWQLTPNLLEATLKTGSDCPYPGQDFFIELYKSVEGDIYPSVISLRFQSQYYKKRFGLMRESIPIEISLGSYKRVPTLNSQHTGSLIKNQGEILWKNDAGDSWALIPKPKDECLMHSSSSSTPNEKLQLILVNTDCDVYNLGFKYLDYYYWKPKRVQSDESPQLIQGIDSLKLLKDFGTHTINLLEVFKDVKGDSLLFFVTSKDSSLVNATIDNQKLVLRGGREGNTTIYAMALDKNGGLAVNEFEVLVAATTTSAEEQNADLAITVSPTVTHDVVYVRGATADCHLRIVSLIDAYQENIALSADLSNVDLSHLAAGMYLCIVKDNKSGKSQWTKVMKY